MKIVNKKLIPFKAIPYNEYDSYIKKAEFIQNRGLLLEESIVSLAERIYLKEKYNESESD